MDAGSPAKSGFAKVRIIVSDGDSLGPVFLQSNYFANLDEETEPGTHVVSVTAQGTGLRVGDRVSYLMDTNVLDGPTAQAYFQVSEIYNVIMFFFHPMLNSSNLFRANNIRRQYKNSLVCFSVD